MGNKITELPVADSVTSDDIVPVVDASTLATKRATVAQVVSAFAGNTPTGTGFRHITAGAEDAAAKLVANADVDAAAAIAVSKLAGSGTDDNVLKTVGGSPVWGAVNLASASAVAGTLPFDKGGTGLSALGTALQVLRTNAGGTAMEWVTPLSPAGSDGDIQKKNGSSLAAIAPSTAGNVLIVNSSGAWVSGRPIAGACTLEQFGAVGDGVTNDSAALTAALAALSAGTYKTLILGAKTYLVPTGGSVPGTCSIIGQGHSSILKTNANAPVLSIGTVNDVVLKDFKIKGNSLISASNQIGVKMGTAGVGASGPQRVYLENIFVEDVWQAGFYYVQNPQSGYGGPIFVGCRATCDSYGFYFAEGGEYVTMVGCQSNGKGSGYGIYVGAGNIACSGCSFVSSYWNVHIAVGSNNAHGIFSGCFINHGTNQNIVIDAITNGHTFIGCNVYAAGIQLTTSVGVVFHDCVIDVPSYVFNGSTGTRFVDCVFPNNYANTVTDNSGGNASSTDWINSRTLSGGVPSFVADRVQVAFSFAADANQTLTIQQSTAETIIVASGVISVARDLTINVTPANAKSRRWLFINNNAQTVNVKFTTGTSVAVATGAKVLVGSDGTNAITLLS